MTTPLPPAAEPARPTPVGFALLALSAIALLLSAGMVAGIAVNIVEDRRLPPLGAALLGGSLAGLLLFGWAVWRQSAYWRRPGQSAYERRYTRMMLVLLGSGLPVGLLLGFAGNSRPDETLFSNAPLSPLLAALAAGTLVVVLAGTLVFYHRTIDDHEERAYLWANSLAFYFLALALPAAWLLSRGGLIAPVGIGGAMLLLLAALGINAAAWAWLKYR